MRYANRESKETYQLLRFLDTIIIDNELAVTSAYIYSRRATPVRPRPAYQCYFSDGTLFPSTVLRCCTEILSRGEWTNKNIPETRARYEYVCYIGLPRLLRAVKLHRPRLLCIDIYISCSNIISRKLTVYFYLETLCICTWRSSNFTVTVADKQSDWKWCSTSYIMI